MEIGRWQSFPLSVHMQLTSPENRGRVKHFHGRWCAPAHELLLANVLSEGCPSIAILINGGAIAKNEMLYNVRQRRPIIVIEGSGRFADEIARILHEKSSLDSDPDLTEIINQGKLYLFPIAGSTLELEQLIQRLLDEQH